VEKSAAGLWGGSGFPGRQGNLPPISPRRVQPRSHLSDLKRKLSQKKTGGLRVKILKERGGKGEY